MADSKDFRSRFEDPRDYLNGVSNYTYDAVQAAQDMDAPDAARIYAQLALAEAIAGLAAAIYMHTKKGR